MFNWLKKRKQHAKEAKQKEQFNSGYNWAAGSLLRGDLTDREELKEGLHSLNEDQKLMFKRMYSHKNLDWHLDDVVDALPEERISTALSQINRTIEINNQEHS